MKIPLCISRKPRIIYTAYAPASAAGGGRKIVKESR